MDIYYYLPYSNKSNRIAADTNPLPRALLEGHTDDGSIIGIFRNRVLGSEHFINVHYEARILINDHAVIFEGRAAREDFLDSVPD